MDVGVDETVDVGVEPGRGGGRTGIGADPPGYESERQRVAHRSIAASQRSIYSFFDQLPPQRTQIQARLHPMEFCKSRC